MDFYKIFRPNAKTIFVHRSGFYNYRMFLPLSVQKVYVINLYIDGFCDFEE